MTIYQASLAILCGGAATRLGTDKGLYAPTGEESLAARAIRLWGDGFAEVLLVVHDAAQAALYQAGLASLLRKMPWVRIIVDAGGGPRAAMVGLFTALTHSREPRVVAIPVDQVGVRSLHIKKLFAGLESERPAAFLGADGEPLPFPSLWPRAVIPELDGLLSSGALGVREALTKLVYHAVDGTYFHEDLHQNGNTADELAAYFGKPLHDPFNRRLQYLRFSLTEACNLACTYCLPDGFPEWYRHKAKLSLNDIEVLLSGFRRLGFRKVRFTGGEPTVHPHCLDAVRIAHRLGYERIALTTNGLLIPDLKPWVEAGLSQLNVSLDSLDSDKFYAVTKSRAVGKVVHLIESAAEVGLNTKVNTVLLRSRNGDMENQTALIDWALSLPITLRFIELMPTHLNADFAKAERVLGTEIEPLLRARGLAPAAPDPLRPDWQGPATNFASPAYRGQIGLINPLSCNFCSKCNRLRVTARGRLKLCLFGDHDHPLDLSSPEAVALNVRRLIDRKPERHDLEAGNVGNVATFRTIGG